MRTLRTWGAMLLFVLMTACADSDTDLQLADVIEGTWIFRDYTLTPDNDDIYIEFDYFVFSADGTFRAYYDGDCVISGVYEAGNSYLRLDYVDDWGDPYRWLMEVDQFRSSDIQLTYDNSDYGVSVTIYLVRAD